MCYLYKDYTEKQIKFNSSCHVCFVAFMNNKQKIIINGNCTSSVFFSGFGMGIKNIRNCPQGCLDVKYRKQKENANKPSSILFFKISPNDIRE